MKVVNVDQRLLYASPGQANKLVAGLGPSNDRPWMFSLVSGQRQPTERGPDMVLWVPSWVQP